jgi:hypothetical protein
MSGTAPPPLPAPPPAGAPSRRPPSTRHAPRLPAIAAVVVLICALTAGGFLLLRPGPQPPADPEAPGRPTDLRASAETCSAERCGRISSSATIVWEAPGWGAPVANYRVDHGGTGAPELLPASARRFTGSVVPGEPVTFRVQAVSAEGRASSAASIRVEAPLPKDDEAQLDGRYRVRIDVRRATGITRLFGIDDPRPGTTGTDAWLIAAACRANKGPCGVKVEDLTATPVPSDGAGGWEGVSRGRSATCADGSTAPVTYRYLLAPTARDLTPAGQWVVTRFTGSVTIGFRCGDLPSSARLRFEGARVAGT